MLVGKFNLKTELFSLINQEIKQAALGRKAHMILKMNSLEDPEIIAKLYEASQADVKVELIVRGICCLIPGVKGLSENISVVSIIDRYLEHARIYYFHNNGEEKVYLSSADLMTRNLDRRIEVAFPIYSDEIKKDIIQILRIQLADNVKARIINKLQKNEYVKNENPQMAAQKTIHQYLTNKEQSAVVLSNIEGKVS